MFPEADIYTSVCYMDHPMLEGRRVYTSWLQKVPFFNKHHKLAGLLRPWAFRSFDLSGYDLVICSSSAESKQVVMGKWNRSSHREERSDPANKKGIPSHDWIASYPKSTSIASQKSAAHNDETKKPITIIYCHTPTRYYWSHAKEYEDMMEFGILNPLVK